MAWRGCAVGGAGEAGRSLAVRGPGEGLGVWPLAP